MSRALSHGVRRALRQAGAPAGQTPALCGSSHQREQLRWHGGGVPEFWGKDSPYHPGTDFLGTPADHLKQVAKRPVSPHVFEVDGKGTHYRFPINAISSIMNRASGVALSVGITGAGFVALTGDLPATVEALKSSTILADATKAAVAAPLLYHYLGGMRHLWWDHANHGLQAEKKGPLTNDAVDRSSWAVLGATVVGTAGLALAWF